MSLSTLSSLIPLTSPALLWQKAQTVFAAGGAPAWRLGALLALLVLALGLIVLPLFGQNAQRRGAAARRARRRAARREGHGRSGDSTFASGHSGLRRSEIDWAFSLQDEGELAALAKVPPARRAPPSPAARPSWDLPTRPAGL